MNFKIRTLHSKREKKRRQNNNTILTTAAIVKIPKIISILLCPTVNQESKVWIYCILIGLSSWTSHRMRASCCCVNLVLKIRMLIWCSLYIQAKGYIWCFIQETEISSYNGGKRGCLGHIDLLKEFGGVILAHRKLCP